MRIFDSLKSSLETLRANRRDRFHGVLSQRRLRGGTHRKAHRLRLIFACEIDGLGSRGRRPARRRIHTHLAVRRALRVIRDRDPNLTAHRGRRTASSGHDRNRRRHPQRERRHHRQLHPLLALELLPFVSKLDWTLDVQLGAAGRQRERRAERCRAERKPERRVRLELVSRRCGQRLPIWLGGPGVCWNLCRRVTPIDGANLQRHRRTHRRNRKPSESHRRHAHRPAAVADADRHAHVLSRYDDPVVRQHFNTKSVRQKRRLSELILLGLQPRIEIESRFSGQSHGRQLLPEPSHRVETGDNRRSGRERAIDVEGFLRCRHVIGNRAQSSGQRRRRRASYE